MTATALAVAGSIHAQEPRTIAVTLDDYSIQMPSSVEPGPAILEITNQGQAEHTIELEGQGVTHAPEDTLLPGQTATLEIDFKPGEYYVWCPIGRHEDYGMHMTLTVSGDQPAGAALTPTTEGPARTQGAGRDAKPVLPKHTPPRPEDLGTATGLKKVLYWLGNFHPPLVSFPIALLVATAVAEMLRLGTGREIFEAIARYCLWFAVLTGGLAGLLGWLFAGFRLVDRAWILTTHRWLGTGTVILALVTLVLSETARRRDDPSLRRWYAALLFLATAAVLTTGFFGGAMIYGVDHYSWR